MTDGQPLKLFCTSDGGQAYGIASAADSAPETVKCPVCGKTDSFKDATADAVQGKMAEGLAGLGSSPSVKIIPSQHIPRWRLG
jgi:hypothetical protein